MTSEVREAAGRRRFYLDSEIRCSPILVLNDCQTLADAYLEAIPEVANVLQMLDELAELWGDEGKFRRCRDRLRAIVNQCTDPEQAQ